MDVRGRVTDLVGRSVVVDAFVGRGVVVNAFVDCGVVVDARVVLCFVVETILSLAGCVVNNVVVLRVAIASSFFSTTGGRYGGPVALSFFAMKGLGVATVGVGGCLQLTLQLTSHTDRPPSSMNENFELSPRTNF